MYLLLPVNHFLLYKSLHNCGNRKRNNKSLQFKIPRTVNVNVYTDVKELLHRKLKYKPTWIMNFQRNNRTGNDVYQPGIKIWNGM
jgi:hypothetical protein